jgi:hypothetical protein
MAKFAHPVIDLPTQYYTAIGEFLFRFSQLEYQIHEILWSVLKLDYKSGRILTIGMDGKALTSIVKNLVNAKLVIKDRSIIARINNLVKEMESYRDLRNAVAHGSWQSANGGSSGAMLHFMKNKGRRILPYADPLVNDASLASSSERIRALNEEAKTLAADIGGPRPLP